MGIGSQPSTARRSRFQDVMSQGLADVADVGLGLLPRLRDVTGEDQPTCRQSESLDLLDGGVRRYGQRAWIGHEVDQGGSGVGEGALDGRADVGGVLHSLAV